MTTTTNQVPTVAMAPATPATSVPPSASVGGAGDPCAQKIPAVYVPTTGFLGLRFDERRRLVTRDGFDGVAASLLDRPQLWELLLELEAAGDTPLERGELAAGCRKRAWKERPGDDESVLRSALNALRSRLKPLGINPRSVREMLAFGLRRSVRSVEPGRRNVTRKALSSLPTAGYESIFISPPFPFCIRASQLQFPLRFAFPDATAMLVTRATKGNVHE